MGNSRRFVVGVALLLSVLLGSSGIASAATRPPPIPRILKNSSWHFTDLQGGNLCFPIIWGNSPRTWFVELPKGIWKLSPHRFVLTMTETFPYRGAQFFEGTWNGTEYLGLLTTTASASVAPGNCPSPPP
jgi:hypothetical protein